MIQDSYIVTDDMIEVYAIRNYILKKSLNDSRYKKIADEMGWNKERVLELLDRYLDDEEKKRFITAMRVKKHRRNRAKVSIEVDFYTYEKVKEYKEKIGAKNFSDALMRLLEVAQKR